MICYLYVRNVTVFFQARNGYGQQIIYDLCSLPVLIAILNHESKNCTSSEVLLNLVLLFVCFRFGVTGFPTLKFFPKDNKEGEEVTTFKVQVCDVMYYVPFLPACPKRCSHQLITACPLGKVIFTSPKFHFLFSKLFSFLLGLLNEVKRRLTK